MRKIVIGIIIAAGVILVVGFVPLVEVPYQDTEIYYEDEPYEVTEIYYEDEPYEVTETYTEIVQTELEIVEHALVRDFLLFVRGKIKNTSNQTLWWGDVTVWVEYEIEDLPGRTFTQPGGLDPMPTTFKPGEIRDFSALVQEGITTYKIIPPRITQSVEREGTVTRYRQIEKERTVTKYRQVERERTVTCYKKGSIFEYLRSRF